MPRFILFLHEAPSSDASMSPEDIQAVVAEYKQWSEKMGAAGKLVGGDKLTNDGGRHMRPNGADVMVSDGPYAETKDFIGGFFQVEASGYDEAVSLSQSCPHLKYGGWIEVRQVDFT